MIEGRALYGERGSCADCGGSGFEERTVNCRNCAWRPVACPTCPLCDGTRQATVRRICRTCDGGGTV